MVSRFRLDLAARVIHAGGVVAYPTEAVYGLGCDPGDAAAVARIGRIKNRPFEAGYILIAADMNQLEPYIGVLAHETRQRIAAGWPGPVTWVVPATAATPAWLTGGRETVAVRVTAHPVAAALCRATGHALVSTSANEHGRAPARTHLAAVRQFRKEVDDILPGSVGSLTGPTEIRSAVTNDILRNS